MSEVGIDLSDTKPVRLRPELLNVANTVVTIGRLDGTSPKLNSVMDEWLLPDPAGQPIDDVRRIRDLVLARVEALATTLENQPMTRHTALTRPWLPLGLLLLAGALIAGIVLYWAQLTAPSSTGTALLVGIVGVVILLLLVAGVLIEAHTSDS